MVYGQLRITVNDRKNCFIAKINHIQIIKIDSRFAFSFSTSTKKWIYFYQIVSRISLKSWLHCPVTKFRSEILQFYSGCSCGKRPNVKYSIELDLYIVELCILKRDMHTKAMEVNVESFWMEATEWQDDQQRRWS